MWCIPQSRLPVLPPDVADAAAAETLPHGEWIRVMAGCGLVVEDLIEVRVPSGAINNDFPEYPDEWVRRWPAEEAWFARRR